MSTDLPPMTGAELLTIREGLGLTGRELAAIVGTANRNLRRWESEEFRIPDSASQLVYGLQDFAEQATDDLVDLLRTLDKPGLILARTDNTYARLAPPGHPYPHRWHRAIAFRALERVRGLRIAFFTDTVIRDKASDDTITWAMFAASTQKIEIAPYKRPQLAQPGKG